MSLLCGVRYERLVIFIILEHILFGMKFVAGKLINDVPTKVLESQERGVRCTRALTHSHSHALTHSRVCSHPRAQCLCCICISLH